MDIVNSPLYVSARPSDEGWKRVDVCILCDGVLYSTQCKLNEYRELAELMANGSHPGDIWIDTFKVVSLSLIVEVQHVSDEEQVKLVYLNEDGKRVKHVVYGESPMMAAVLAERIALDAGVPQPPTQKPMSLFITLMNYVFFSVAVLVCLGFFLHVSVSPEFDVKKERNWKAKLLILTAKKMGPVWISVLLGVAAVVSTYLCVRRYRRRPTVSTYRYVDDGKGLLQPEDVT